MLRFDPVLLLPLALLLDLVLLLASPAEDPPGRQDLIGSGVVSPVSPARRDPGEDAGVTSLCLGVLTQIYNVNSQA